MIQTRDGSVRVTYTGKRERIKRVVLHPNRIRERAAPRRSLAGRLTLGHHTTHRGPMTPFHRTAATVLAAIGVLSVTSCGGRDTQPAADAPEAPVPFPSFDRAAASDFARLALKAIEQEYPNKLDHVMNGPAEVREPRALHPAFYGSFDWHSSVHGHWMLVRLLERFPDLPEAQDIRATLDQHLSATNIATEVAYLGRPNRASFERTYGWAWLLQLEKELREWNDPDGARWAANLQPLADAIVQRYLDFLPKQTYPIRRGVHPNTAFGMTFALDYARAVGRKDLEDLLVERSRTYFGADTAYPAQWEPDGDDFLSRSLIEADLMRRVLPGADFAAWFHAFLPGIAQGEPRSLLEPAIVGDRSDPKLVHLDGLNLSRAWCMRGIASALPADDPDRPMLLQAAARHANATLPYIASGNYEGEHWLASFAVYMFTEGGDAR